MSSGSGLFLCGVWRALIGFLLISRNIKNVLVVLLFAIASNQTYAACSTDPVSRSPSQSLLPGGCSSGNNVCAISNFTTNENSGYRYFDLTLCESPQEMDDHCDPDVFDSQSNSCVAAPEECGVDDGKTPQQCSCEEAGGGWISGFDVCTGYTDEDDCNINSPNFQGTADFGGGSFPVCDNQQNCSGGDTYGAWTNPDGSKTTGCLPADTGPPDCDFDTVAVAYSDNKDDGGFACAPVSQEQTPEQDTDNDGTPDSNDTDLDGDGIPNEADNDVDGDGTPNDQDSDYQKPNTQLAGIDQQLEQSNKTQNEIGRELQDIGMSLSGIDDNIANGTSKSAASESGIETIESSNNRISQAFTDLTTYGIFSIPTIATSTTCPTYTVGSTAYWNSLKFDGHCSVLESNRGLFEGIFLMLWTIAAVIIFLKA